MSSTSHSLVCISLKPTVCWISPLPPLVPAIIYIDKWGRRPMLLVGLMLMGFWLFLVGGLQARFGHWDTIAGAGKLFYSSFRCCEITNTLSTAVWVVENNRAATNAIIVCSYFFVCRSVSISDPVFIDPLTPVLSQFRYHYGTRLLDISRRTGTLGKLHSTV